VLVVTAVLAVLLAVLSHLAWPPVVVAILGTVPALYLAWAALPGAISPPGPGAADKAVYGRRVEQWDPVELGVHQVIGGGPMPTYIRRPHDELLQAVLDPVVPASRLVVVRGGSSTGKTRAAYQAVADWLAGWQLDYPLDPGALAARLEAGIPARTVLWLGELRQYADADGGLAVLGRLADLLQGEGRLVITTMWPEQWTAYTAAARAGPGTADPGTADPAGVAGRLLTRLPELTGRDPARINLARGGVIDVPDRFAAADLDAAARAGDPVLAEAAAAAAGAGEAGQVTQYLAGVPDLLRRYAGSGGDPYGQAVITAAMDAARLGHASPLSAALLQEAAVGYLTGLQRTRDIASWRDTALDWATAELRGAVRALQPVPPPSGTGVAGYQVADYLDQYGRRTRQDQLGPPSLWDALAEHTTGSSDLGRLGNAARDRGLYRHAVLLWKHAIITSGNASAAAGLIGLLHKLGCASTQHASQWVTEQAALDDPFSVVLLLGALHAAGADQAIATLLARHPAEHAAVEDAHGVAALLEALQRAGVGQAASTLAARAAEHASLEDPFSAALLLKALSEAGADQAIATLLARHPAEHIDIQNRLGVVLLLRELHMAGADQEADTLAARAAELTDIQDPLTIVLLLRELRAARADRAVSTLKARANHAAVEDAHGVAVWLRALGGDVQAIATFAASAAEEAAIENALVKDPLGVAEVLQELRKAGIDQAASMFAARAAEHAALDNAHGVAQLLQELRAAGADQAIAALLDRHPAQHAGIEDPLGVAELLGQLRAAGADQAIAALLDRHPAEHADIKHAGIENRRGITELLEQLRAVGAGQAASTLAARAADGGLWQWSLEADPNKARHYTLGREPDGTPSPPWDWQGRPIQDR
jgi:hypothetical protein